MDIGASAGDPIPGRTLGDFVIRQKIGEGGFGTVYRADQPLLARQAVIKVLRASHSSNPEIIQRFLREARLASKLDHPYAAHIYAFGAEEDGLLWIAMELVRGTTLDEMLKVHGALPLERFVPLFDRICEVVHAAHDHGIIHRDLKPANVMVLSRAGRLLPKLLDFGIAKGLDRGEPPVLAGSSAPMGAGEVTLQGATVGSPHYMAPEQWLDATRVDSRTDIYALGVLAYESLTGSRPFVGETIMEIARAHARGAPPPLGGGLPPTLDAVLGRAMAKKAAQRFASAIELAAAVRAAAGLDGETETLPQLDEPLRELFLAAAPQPLAEAIAALEGARNAHQALGSLWNVVQVAARLVGVLALAARTRLGARADSTRAAELLRALHLRELVYEDWLELARELMRPWAKRRDAYPVPELMTLVEQRTAFDDLCQLRASSLERAAAAESDVRELLARAVPLLARGLRAVSFLCEYTLVLQRDEVAERWSGVPRRGPRRSVTVRGPRLSDGHCALLDIEGRPVLSLWPLVQVSAPVPGAAEELFLFTGRGRAGARMVAFPAGFERQDDTLWDWFRGELVEVGAEGGAGTADERPPYRGLASFTAEQADLFFGREREVDAVVNRLRVQSLVAVVGPSGAGKSSFVHAGVIPALPRGWNAVTVRPGPAPLAALAARLGGPVEDLDARLRADLGPGEVRVLVVDQLEELLTLCLDPAERLRYAEVLARAAGSVEAPLRVIVTLRDDFLGRAEQLAPLRNRLAHGLQLLTTPAPEDLQRILVEPARRAGYDFEDRQLPSEMVQAVADQAGALALLSFTAAELWELRDRHFKLLPRRAYLAMGGVGGALAQHAEKVLAAFGPEEHRLVREAFRHLVTADGTRAVLGRGELEQILGSGARADAVIAKLTDARLLVTSEGIAGEERIEVVHEALLGAWPRLAAWRQEDAEGARLRDQLRAAARQWDDRGRVRGLLWRDEALAEYRLWRGRHAGRLADVEEAFAAASIGDATTARRRRRLLAAAGVFALAVAVIILVVLNRQKERQRVRADVLAHEAHEALVEQYVEQGRQRLLAGDAMRALVYLEEAQKQGAHGAAFQFLLARAMRPLEAHRRTFTGHGDKLQWAEFSRDGRLAVTASTDRTARIWRVCDGQAIATLSGHDKEVRRAHFDGEGKRIVTAGVDGTARVWGVDGTLLATLSGHKSPLYDATFSPDGRHVVTASKDSWAGLFSAETGALLKKLSATSYVQAASFSPDGTTIATVSSDKLVRLFDSDGDLRHELAGHTDRVMQLAFAPDGKLVATAALDLKIKLWDVESGKELASLEGHSHKIEQLVFDRSGSRLVSASRDGTARVWDTAARRQLRSLDSHGGIVSTASFDPDGQRVVTALSDGRAVIWGVASGLELATLQGHASLVKSAQFSPDGKLVLTASLDGTARVWQATPTELIHDLSISRDILWDAAFSPDGSRLVVGGAEGRTLVWDTVSGRLLADLKGHTANIQMVSYRRDGAVILTASDDGTARVWDDRTLALRATLAHGSRVHFACAAGPRVVTGGDDNLVKVWVDGVLEQTFAGHTEPPYVCAISPDDKVVATAGYDGTVRLWSFSGEPVTILEGHGKALVRSVSFSADGKLLLTSSADRTAIIWDVGSGRPRHRLVGHAGVVHVARFSTDGRRVVTGSEDATAIVWDTATGTIEGRLEGHGNLVFDADISPDGRLIATASDDGTLRLWDSVGFRLLASSKAHAGWARRAIFQPGKAIVLGTVGEDGAARLWSFGYENRPQAAVEELRRCVPYTLRDGKLSAFRPVACQGVGDPCR